MASDHLHAGFWRRAGAMGIDSLILTVPNMALLLGGRMPGNPWVEMGVWTFVGWLYYGMLHSSRWQATPGKRAFGIKVTDLHGARIGFGRATGRYFATFLSGVIFGIGYFMAGWTARKQALHDKLARTLVVDAGIAAEDIERGGGVMPLPARTKIAVAALLIAQIALSLTMMRFADPFSEEMRKAEGLRASTSPTAAKQEQLSYAIYTFPFFGGERTLLAEGTRTYRHSEIFSLLEGEGERPMTIKVLQVAQGYSVHANLFREDRISGFGLSLAKDGGGFSWEWFDHESGDIFRKLQGAGQVQVRFREVDGKEELAEVLFLDDVTMRLNRYWLIPFRHRDSDHMVIKRGSVLWLAD